MPNNAGILVGSISFPSSSTLPLMTAYHPLIFSFSAISYKAQPDCACHVSPFAVVGLLFHPQVYEAEGLVAPMYTNGRGAESHRLSVMLINPHKLRMSPLLGREEGVAQAEMDKGIMDMWKA
jgi:hypothetical protein